MRFNAQKCYTLSTRNTSPYLYNLCGAFLKHVAETPYLGVQISNNLKIMDFPHLRHLQ